MRKNKVIFIKNALVLTVTGLFIRFLGMFFRVWLASAVGAEGIGLYSQIFSFYMLSSAFASAGINTAVTRLVSEELSSGNFTGARTVVKRCVFVTLFIALSSSLIIFLSADFIANRFIGDQRSVESLKTLTLSLPFMGVSSCLKGYFIARKKAAPSSSAQIFEQLSRIALIFFLLSSGAKKSVAAAARSVILGDSIAEILSCFYLYICYNIDNCNILSKENKGLGYSVLAKLKHIALPITVGRYLNSTLRTIENVLVPKRLERYGMKYSDALSVFGVIKGMALPLIFFPSSFLNAMSTLLIPEMSEASFQGRALKVKYTAEKCIHITLISSFPLAVIFFYGSAPLGMLFYRDASAGETIRLLAPIIPLMYLDSVCDGLLKGLDEQASLFRNSLFDSIIRLTLIMLFLDKTGLVGFIGIMYISNAFTCLMNLFNLKKIAKAEIKWARWALFPALLALVLGTSTYLIIEPLKLSNLLFSIIFASSTALLYLFCVTKAGCITRDDLR